MKIFNSLSKTIETFTPRNNKSITMYVCGITPYDTTHLGHAFTYVFFDVLLRYLKFKGFEVVYTQNVTDINDRDNDILARARQQNIPWQQLATFWTDKFLRDMQSLNWIKPTHYLKASENITSMIRIIREIVAKKYGYTVNGSVYLDITKVKDFGKLSRLSQDEMLIKAKEFEEDIANPDKRNPLDITLWRAASSQLSLPARNTSRINAGGRVAATAVAFDATQQSSKKTNHIPSFSSPFGPGRPGWHIECSGMSIQTLGDQIDIHGGGQDLIYPHHESEIAQSESATGAIPFAKYWVHTGTVGYQGKKMSKSIGNLVLVSDLLKKYSPNAIRWVLLSHHYRSSWEFKEEELVIAEKKVNSLKFVRQPQGSSLEYSSFLDDDMNIPGVLVMLQKNPSKSVLEMLGFTL